MSLISYLILHLFLSCFPFYILFISHLFCVFSNFFLCVFLSYLFHIRICTCSPFVLRLFSVYSSFVFNLFYVCFPPSLYLFFICRHLFYAHSSFLPHLFSICFFHLFSIYFPFILHFIPHLFFRSFAILSWSQIWFVRGQGSIPFCRMIDFPLEISSKPANGCQGETQSFPGKTLHVRLGSEIREL